jgi:NagD protein
MDGTIYKGNTLFDFTTGFLGRLASLGIGCTFLTNNSSRSVNDYLKKLLVMGIEADENNMFTSTLSTVDYLRDEMPAIRRIYLLGTPSLREEFVRHGYHVVDGDDEPEAVIAGFDTGLSFDRLCKATWWVSQGKPFIATHPDLTCPTDLPTVLVDCGAICRCIEAATGIAPARVLGKPDARMLTGILKRHGLEPHELAMAGDRIYTDIAMARCAGAFGVLVLTGEATREDAAECSPPPDLIVPSLSEFGEMLSAARAGS